MADKYSVYLDSSGMEFIRRLKEEYPDYFPRAMRNWAWYVQQQGKKGIKKDAPGGSKYPKPFVYDVTEMIRRYKKGSFAAPIPNRRPPLNQLRNAFLYNFSKGGNSAVVGWVDPNAARYGEYAEEGKQYRVTPKMRRMFFGMGIHLPKGKSNIVVPKRKTVPPVFNEVKDEYAEHVAERMMMYIRGER